jgi:seryl-tRNA synthetase
VQLFLILQIFFDTVLLFGILFLFHFSVHQTQRKKEESDILDNVHGQEIRENLQELLMTLKQLGKEVSDNIQEQVKTAETKTENFKKAISRFQKDLTKVNKLSDELNLERLRLEEKANVIEASKTKTSKVDSPPAYSSLGSNPELKKNDLRVKNMRQISSTNFSGSGKNMVFSSESVKEVCRLSDLRMEINEIVLRTKLSRAEVQLILNLHVNRFAGPN